MSADVANFRTDPAIDLIRTVIPADKPDWTENIAWSMNDPASGISIYGHLGRMQPDRSIWEGLSLFFLPGGEMRVSRSLGRNPRDGAGNPEYHYKPIVPNTLWQFAFDGVVQRVDAQQLRRRPVGDEPFEAASYQLVFEALQPVFNMHKSDLDSERMHLEHGGTMKGTVVIGGKRIEINCTAYRDHSVSRRTFTTLDTETWSNCAFPSGRIFSILEVSRSGRQILEGQAYIDGKMQFAKPLVVPDLQDSSGAPHTGTISVETDSGRHSIRWETLQPQFVPFQLLRPVGMRPGIDLSDPENMVAVQCPAKFHWDGETGYGWMERTRPLKALRN
jgi:hypothetical protein